MRKEDQTINPNIPFTELKKYSDGKFVDEKKNLCLIGEPGVGKTHTLIAIGRDLCRKGYTVYFFYGNTIDCIVGRSTRKKSFEFFYGKNQKSKTNYHR